MRHAIAQTNLQLYGQMIELGYGDEALELANRAYLFAERATAGILRGSGKPFACHLAGTASAVAAEGLAAPVIAASLLHALYQDRIRFPGAATAEQRRAGIRDRFGAEVESLVHAYHAFETARLDDIDDDSLVAQRTVVVMRLADELDDLVDDAIAMHGKPGDGESVGGSAASRRAQKAGHGPTLLRVARLVGTTHLPGHLEHWLDRTARVRWPEGLRSGEYSSFEVSEAGA
jgi:hypothetical protein